MWKFLKSTVKGNFDTTLPVYQTTQRQQELTITVTVKK